VARIIWNSFKWTTVCYFCILAGAVLLSLAAIVLIKVYNFFANLLTANKAKKPGYNNGTRETETGEQSECD